MQCSISGALELDMNDKTEPLSAIAVDPLVMRCPDCGYTQQDAELHLDHCFCKNPNPPWIKYFRSQAIACDPGTMMYWVEYADGKAGDIEAKRIPDGAIVTDVTFENGKRSVRKCGNTFVSA